MKAQLILALALVVSVTANAQRRVAQYDEATNTVVEVEQIQQQTAPQQVIESGRSPIVILNTNQKVQPQVQEQPNTVVEAAPLADSQAERLRKQRQGLEIHTEQKIVEKLEEARMEDEKARAERLFGGGFKSRQNEERREEVKPAPTPAYVAPVEPVPVVVAPQPAPQQVIIVKEEKEVKHERVEKEDKVDVRSEVRMAVDELNKKEEPKSQLYVGGVVGMAEYPRAVNMKSNIATGVTVGMLTDKNIAVEGSFLYTDHEVDDYSRWYENPFKTVTQYNFLAAVKYQLGRGSLRPFLGGVAGYTLRKSEDRMDMYGGYGSYAYGGDQTTGSSNAFDVGVTGGFDVQLTPSFAIAAEARYMTNVSYRRDYEPIDWNSAYSAYKPMEELDYYTLTVGGKFTF